MSSRNAILNSIRRNKPEHIELPNLESLEPTTFEDKIGKFSEVVQTVGGEAIVLEDATDLDAKIKELYPEAKKICATTKLTTLASFDANSAEKPHELEDVDLVIAKGNFAVAENGAVWVKNEENHFRALYFIAAHIVLVVDKNEVLNNMHEAYERVDFSNAGYGVFVSGPSKTADIEQSLVIGAHGPKSGYILFV